MTFLLNIHHSSPDADDCMYAFVVLTPELAAKILERKETFDLMLLADFSLACMEYYDGNVKFLNALPLLDNGDDRDGPEDAFAETDLPLAALEENVERTECERMVIDSTDVYWTAIPKHGDSYVETRPIDYDTIRKAVAV